MTSEKGLELRMPDNLQEKKEDLLLTHFHSLAQLRDKVNEFVKVLEMEMKKVKGQFLTLNEKK